MSGAKGFKWLHLPSTARKHSSALRANSTQKSFRKTSQKLGAMGQSEWEDTKPRLTVTTTKLAEHTAAIVYTASTEGINSQVNIRQE